MSAVVQRSAMEQIRRVGVMAPHEALLWAPRKHVDYSLICEPHEIGAFVDQRIILEMTTCARASRHPSKKGRIIIRARDTGGREHRLTAFGDLRFSEWNDVPVGQSLMISVKPSEFSGEIYLHGPEIVPQKWIGRVMPVYAGKPRVVSSETVGAAVAQALEDPNAHVDALIAIRQSFGGLEEIDILKRAGTGGSLAMLLDGLHRPASIEHATWAMDAARALAAAYVLYEAERAGQRPLRLQTTIRINDADINRMIGSLPFRPTTGEESQEAAIHAICHSLGQPYAMDAILTADVGVGKTLCYMVPAVASQATGAKVAVLVPNTLLAEQIAGEFRSCFPECPVSLITDATRKETVQWDQNPVLIGTTRLFSVARKAMWHPNLLVIDEQQKMSVEQRAELCNDDTNVLEASATPIPRTVAMLRYGGKERIVVSKRHAVQDIRTYVVGTEHRGRMFDMLKKVVAAGQQVAVIYPRVEANGEGDSASVVAAGASFEKLCPGQVVVLHGKMSTEEKIEAMALAKSGQRSIIIGSSIIEIGITIANLRMLIVVSADRYGVSTLHQFRGRLARHGGWGAFFAYLPNEVDEDTAARIQLLAQTNDGFELAELDLLQRGFGDLATESNDTSGRSRTLFRGIDLMPQDFQ